MNSSTQTPMPPRAETPVRSMTGFAQVRRTTSAGELTLSFRAVNHKALDLHFHLPSELMVFENGIRAAIKRSVARGHVEVRGSLLPPWEAQSAAYNRAAVARYVAAFRRAASEWGLNQEPDLNVALSQPDVWQQTEGAVDERIEPDVLSAAEECIAAFNVQREREGGALADELQREILAIRNATEQIAAIRGSALPLFKQRLRDRLSELLAQSTISEARLTEEAAMLAERSDIQEELTRLAIHTGELSRTLAKGGEMGKRLDFLLQEMNRETNTILSKTSGIGDTGLTVTQLALSLKSHIEKIREQALNIE